MGNDVTVSTPIASSRTKMAEELEAKRKEALAKSKSKKVEEKKQPSKKELKQAADQQTAMNVFEAATQNIKIENYTNFDDYRTACRNAFQAEVDTRVKTAEKTDDLTPEQIKIAQKYMKSKEFKAAKQEIRFNNQNHIRSLQGNVDGTTKGERKDQTDAILKQQYEAKEAELKKQYESGKITEQKYKQLRKENKKEYKDYKKDNRTTNGFQRFFGAKETAADRIHSVGAKQATLETTREFMTSDKKGAVESRINPELMSKINRAGYSIEDLYDIYDDNSGTDATVNYSYKKKQEGERDQLLARLNENLPEGAEEFKMEDVKDLGDALGYNVEKAVDGGKVLRDMGRAAIPGLGLLPIASKAKATAIAADGTTAKDKAFVPTGVILFGVAEGVAAGASVYTQYTRVEDRAIPTNVPDTVKTLEEYNAYLDKQATPEGARLGKAIAKYYENPETKQFDIAQLNKALKSASGTVDTTGTPCNYEEAEALLTVLKSGKIKPNFEKPVEPEITQEVVVNTQDPPVIEERKVVTYKIKYGDNPWAIAQGVYGNGNKYVRKVQAMIPDGAAFWKVGTEVDFGPIELPDGTTVDPIENPNVIAGRVVKTFKGRSTANTNQVERRRVVKGATYGADAYNVDKNGNKTYKQNVTSGHTNVIDRNNKVNEYKKKTETETHRVTVE